MKNVIFSFNLPARYKWAAFQPFGALTFFINKPKIVSEFVGDGLPPVEFWGTQMGEITIDDPRFQEMNKNSNWKNSLKKI